MSVSKLVGKWLLELIGFFAIGHLRAVNILTYIVNLYKWNKECNIY